MWRVGIYIAYRCSLLFLNWIGLGKMLQQRIIDCSPGQWRIGNSWERISTDEVVTLWTLRWTLQRFLIFSFFLSMTMEERYFIALTFPMYLPRFHFENSLRLQLWIHSCIFLFFSSSYNVELVFSFIFLFQDGDSPCLPGFSAVAQSWLTATSASASRVQTMVLPQPPKQLGLQACTTSPG